MQNKGLIRLFAILFGLVSIYQLSFTFVANSIEEKAKMYAAGQVDASAENYTQLREQAERSYLDSLKNEKVYNLGFTSYNYSEVKDRELNKGLDLKGGINVILQISVKDIIRGLSNYSKEPTFNEALLLADQLQKQTQDAYVESFFQAFDQVNAKNGTNVKLASPDIFANKSLSGSINFDSADNEVKNVIRTKVDESVVSAFEVLRKRIDKFGVTQPNIQRLGSTGRILVELPGAKDIDRVKKLLQSTAQLEFWETYKADELVPFISAANQYLKETVKPKVASQEVVKPTGIDSLLVDVKKDSLEQAANNNPLFDLFNMEQSRAYPGGPVVATVAIKDTATFNAYLKMPQVRNLLQGEQKFVRFAWSKPETDLSETLDLYALKSNRDAIPPLSGSVIVDAQQSYDQLGQPSVTMQMDGTGAKIWEQLTGKASQQNSNIAIVLDNVVYSAPGVSRGAISGGRSEISGNFTLNEAIDLANVLRAGKLPASADIIQSEVVGPSLGQEAIDSGVSSFMIAFAIVLLWMIFYYGYAGAFADVALLFNLLVIFGVMSGLGAVLTLPGIAGIVLTIGMSVDANVIIYERAKEELFAGKNVKEAVAHAFSWKGAMSSIFDANITTALTALILFLFGTGPIKGFATTLLIGIATSLFSAIFISRLFIEWFLNKGKQLDFSTPITKKWFTNLSIDFLGKKKIAYLFSGSMIVVALISLFSMGLNWGVDFVGGRTYQVRFENPISATEVQTAIVAEFGSGEVKTFGSPEQLKITTKYKVEEEGNEVDDEIEQKLFTVLQPYLPDGTTLAHFATISEDKSVGIMKTFKVTPTIADDIQRNSVWAILGSLIIVFIYILMRFAKWQFSLGAVAAVFHDVLVVMGVFSIFYKFLPFNMEIDQAFIAAILTVIGYSLNDTVIVFDRIREYLSETSSRKFDTLVNEALNSTLSRTINTSATTIVVLLTIFLFGGESIRGFIFAILVGIVVGTYSSLFVATPIMTDTINKAEAKKALKGKN
ncbi:MAG: protein translocase subunit SecDF [Bacteroidetes bacterium]|nr:protein translocase subunit SecDF [Bacteroidota bacterium]